MARSSNPFAETLGSDDELSSLGINTFTFAPTTDDAQPPRDPHDAQDDDCDVDTHESTYEPSDQRDIHGLVDDATSHTSRLITFFMEVSAMLHTPEVAKNANLCAAMHSCLTTIPGTAVTPVTDYVPPEESSWRQRRRALEESLLKNLRKYIRFSDHLLRKPPRTDKFQGELNKLHAFADKFFHLSMKLQASNEKMRLMELCETYQRMKLTRLEERQFRASLRADRAARKTQREMLRQQRRPP
ncbi:hypothetical protein B0H17DRAFT_1084481 [Mycena rosella]|uniref:Uncharacterized protein n=1 Tax=Mycena rosella TaxID=1033263 RepID=A0AAD7D1F2_MYCRO|nr:hypothetical protein B0H17DRAFT_1084481 [Mycena rosella]